MNFTRCIQIHVDPQLRADTALDVLEDAVAEAVPADVGSVSAGEWRGGPEVAALLVAEVEGFAARIAHRVVPPGREAELVGVLAPRVCRAALRDDGAEVWVGQHVNPGRRRHLPGGGRNHVLPPIRAEPPEAVEEDEVGAGRRGRRLRSGLVGTVGSDRREGRHGFCETAATVDLVRKGASMIGEDGASDRLEQDAVLVRDLFSRPHEDATRAIGHVERLRRQRR